MSQTAWVVGLILWVVLLGVHLVLRRNVGQLIEAQQELISARDELISAKDELIAAQDRLIKELRHRNSLQEARSIGKPVSQALNRVLTNLKKSTEEIQ